MASKTKTQQVKSAGSSPAQPTRLQALAAPLPPQAPPKSLTVEDLQRVIQSSSENLEKNLEKKITTQIKEVTLELAKIHDTLENHNIAIREDIVEAFKGVWGYTLQIENRVLEVEQQNEKYVERLDEIQKSQVDGEIMREFKEMQWAVRMRGLKENNQTQEELRKIFAKALSSFIGESVVDCAWQIDDIYRVNSWMARQKNLPRDIVIYFVTRRIRNLVTTTSYRKKFMVEGQEITIMKEIPLKMLRSRKEYAFLVEELRRRELKYRWEAPEGLTVNLQGKRYSLTSVWKAKDFYINVLNAGVPPSPVHKKKEGYKDSNKGEKEVLQPQIQGGLEMFQDPAQEVDLLDMAAGGSIVDIFQPLQMEIPQTQRQTRAATKRMEQELKSQQIAQETVSMELQSQAMGGARPKSTQQSFDLALQRLAGIGHAK